MRWKLTSSWWLIHAVVLCLFLAPGGMAAMASSLDDFKAANQLYDAGKFADAAALYEKIEPKTANVYYNLGNACFREGKLGLAILNYQRARQLDPRDPDFSANLRFAEQHAGVAEVNAIPQAWKRFLRSAVGSRTVSEWSVFELIALWIVVLAAAVCIWRPKLRTGFLVFAAAAFLAFAFSTFALGYAIVREHSAPAAVVIAGETPARFAPMTDSTVHFKLTEGANVLVLEDRGPWVFVERADGQQGWVPSDAITRVSL